MEVVKVSLSRINMFGEKVHWSKCIVFNLICLLYFFIMFCSNSAVAYNRGPVRYCPDQLIKENNYISVALDESQVQNVFKSFEDFLINKTNVVWEEEEYLPMQLVDAAVQTLPEGSESSVNYALKTRLPVPSVEEDLLGTLKCCAIIFYNKDREEGLWSRKIMINEDEFIVKQWMCGKVEQSDENTQPSES